MCFYLMSFYSSLHCREFIRKKIEGLISKPSQIHIYIYIYINIYNGNYETFRGASQCVIFTKNRNRAFFLILKKYRFKIYFLRELCVAKFLFTIMTDGVSCSDSKVNLSHRDANGFTLFYRKWNRSFLPRHQYLNIK